jgi:hypothetical protein
MRIFDAGTSVPESIPEQGVSFFARLHDSAERRFSRQKGHVLHCNGLAS